MASIIFGMLAIAGIVSLTNPTGGDLVGPVATMIGFSAAGATILARAGRLDGRERAAWTVIGIGFGLGTAGMLVVAVLDVFAGGAPAFGPTDLFFIAAYAVILTGFAYLPHQPRSPIQRLRVYLDSLIGALSVGVVMWILVLDELLHEMASASAWERWAGTAYPLFDVAALIVVTIVVSRRSAYRFDPRLVLFAVGLGIQVYADLAYLRAGVGQSFGSVNPNFAAFVVASAFYYGAALIVDRSPRIRSFSDRPASLWSVIAPYGAAGGLVALLIGEISLSGLTPTGRAALVATVVVGILVLIRQSVAIHENRRLLDRHRSDLVSSISHELRTPLTAVVGFLEALAADDGSISHGERRELMGIATEQARYLERLVADMAPLRIGGSKEIDLEESEVSIAQIASRTMSSLAGRAGCVSVDIEEGLFGVVDEHRVHQVLVNLVSNALRYGGGAVEVVGRRTGTDLVIEVHDDGPGVAKKWHVAMWNRFERGAHRYNSVQPGSGIGLAVVAAVAVAHGGKSQYRESERLGGACFSLVLPGRARTRRLPESGIAASA